MNYLQECVLKKRLGIGPMAEQPLGKNERTGNRGLTEPKQDWESVESVDSDASNDDRNFVPLTSDSDSFGNFANEEPIVRGRYFIDSTSPLSHLDSPTARAYKVEDKKNPTRPLFGLICLPDMPTQINNMAYYKKSQIPGMLSIIDWAPIYWAPLNQRTMAVVYNQPYGNKIFDQIVAEKLTLSGYDIPNKIVKPLLLLLEEHEANNLAYRAISARNLYFLDEKMNQVVLGENVTALPGFNHNSIFEPIERAICNPEGRGTGSVADDIFSLGVTIGILVIGYNPFENVNEEDQIRKRLSQGSFNAIFGSIQFGNAAQEITLTLVTPLRGMMHDDPLSRWSCEDIRIWLNGDRPTIASASKVSQARSPFIFQNKTYLNPQVLAFDFSNNTKDASRCIQNDEAFTLWLKRGLNNSDKADAVDEVIQSAAFNKTSVQGSDDYIVTKVCGILDPDAPIRFKGFNFMPDGFAGILAIAASRKNRFALASEILTHDIPILWLDLQDNEESKIKTMKTRFLKLKKMLSNNKLGAGLERVLYEINPHLRCLSPYLSKDYVLLMQHFLPALNAAGNYSDTQLKPMDRHIIAFIRTRFDFDIELHLNAINSHAEDKVIIGLLSLYASIQWRLEQPEMLSLSSWIGGLLGPVIESYRSFYTRERIKKNIPQLVRLGSLPELFDLVDNEALRLKDKEEYFAAKIDWQSAQEEINTIEDDSEEHAKKVENNGKQSVVTVSIILSLIFVTILFTLKIL